MSLPLYVINLNCRITVENYDLTTKIKGYFASKGATRKEFMCQELYDYFSDIDSKVIWGELTDMATAGFIELDGIGTIKL